MILAAWYLLHAFRQVAQGKLTNPANFKDKLPDLNWGEIGQLLPLVLLFFVIGLAPNFLLDKINPSVAALEVVQTPVVVEERYADHSSQPPFTTDINPLTTVD